MGNDLNTAIREDITTLYIKDLSVNKLYISSVEKTDTAADNSKNYENIKRKIESAENDCKELYGVYNLHEAADENEHSDITFENTGEYSEALTVSELNVNFKPSIISLSNEVFYSRWFYLKEQDLYVFDNDKKCYVKLNEKELKNTVLDLCGTFSIYNKVYVPGKLKEIKDRIEGLCRENGRFITDETAEGCNTKLNFLNGIYDIQEMRFVKTEEIEYCNLPIFQSLNCCYYEPKERAGKTEHYKRLMKNLFDDKRELIRFGEELLASCITGQRNGKRIYWIVDPSGALHEILYKFFEEIYGSAGVSRVSLSSLKESKLFVLEGKKINISVDEGLAKLNTGEFPLSQISSTSITINQAKNSKVFVNSAIYLNFSQVSPDLSSSFARLCCVLRVNSNFSEVYEIFNEVKPEIPYIVSYLADTIYSNMYKERGLQANPNESLIAACDDTKKFNAIGEFCKNHFIRGEYEVLIKEDAYKLYEDYVKRNCGEPLGRNFFYKYISSIGIKEKKLGIVDKKTGEELGRRTVFIGISHRNNAYKLSSAETEKIKHKL